MEVIKLFQIPISFFSTHFIKDFLAPKCLDEVRTLEVVVVAVVRRKKKNLILTLADSKECVYSFAFYVEFYSESAFLAEQSSRGEVSTFPMKIHDFNDQRQKLLGNVLL